MDLVAWERLPLWMLGLHAYLMQTEKGVDFLLLNCLTIEHQLHISIYIYIYRNCQGEREKKQLGEK